METQTIIEHIRLNPDQRTAVRRAICNHASWERYRRANGNMTASDLTSSLCLTVAAEFGIDVHAVLAAMPATAPQAAPQSIPVTAPAVDTDSATAAALAALRQLFANSPIDAAAVREIVRQELDGIIPTQRIILQDTAGATLNTATGQHPMFASLCRALACKQDNGLYNNVWLAGPAGSGKSYAAKEAAKFFNLPFYFNGSVSMDHKLEGFVDGAGAYHLTAFRQAYETGGLYCFDECDGGESAPLLVMNAALAGDRCTFPDSPVPVMRHENFRCVATGNTYGLGATVAYTGRAKLDAAFLDRFGVKLPWEYDAALERSMVSNQAWVERVQKARAKAAQAGMQILITPRHSLSGAAFIAAGASPDEAARFTYLAGLSADQITILEGVR